MTEPILIDIDEGIAAVKLKEKWHFFHDYDWNFLLDWGAYKYGSSKPADPTDFRYNTLVVDENNAEEWMNLLEGELTAEQVHRAVYEGGGQVPLRFVIDFDQKLWVGHMWNMDQSALDEYQPADWTAREDDVFKYVPQGIARLWDGQLVTEDVLLLVDDIPHTLIAAGTRPVWWGAVRVTIDTSKTDTLYVEIKQALDHLAAQTLNNLPRDEQFDLCFQYFLGYDKHLAVEVRRCPPEPGYTMELFADLGSFALK